MEGSPVVKREPLTVPRNMKTRTSEKFYDGGFNNGTKMVSPN